MYFQNKLTLFSLIFIIASMSETDCKRTPEYKFIPRESNQLPRRDFAESIMTVTDMPLDISSVFSEAGGVFGKIIGKMLSNKKLVGLNSGWYW